MDKNLISIDGIELKKNRIDYFLKIKGEVAEVFNLNTNMFVEYRENIEEVPRGIAIIPLLSNILPIIWFSNSEIIIDELDETFYKSIEKIKNAYMKMHSKANLRGEIIVKKIINYDYKASNECATFFSGGVDSLSTLISRIDRQPKLVTLWGSDIKLQDKIGWNNVENEVVNFAENMNLKNVFIKSSFREFINEGILTKKYSKCMKDDDNWWHGAQHGIGLIGHIAPYAYIHKLNTLYIPASLSPENQNYSCASHPTIDNEFKFAGCDVVHEGFNNMRQDKVKIISEYINETKKNYS